MGQKYEVLPHTADYKVKVFGNTKEELFSNAVLAMYDGLKPRLSPGNERIKKSISLNSADSSALLADFLSEVLYLMQVHKEVYNELRFLSLIDSQLAVKLTGQKVEGFGEDIKAVTYHDLDVHQRNDGSWEAMILFDI
ncbi:MAG: archease [Candidatus Pacebacteria bacterium]|nr:archease [Candidatus Paceibacterota bacterium]